MRKKSNLSENNTFVMNEYGRVRLMSYAESFQDLAEAFSEIQKKESCELQQNQEKREGRNRQEYIMKRTLFENREILADHLFEMASIMNQVAKESVVVRKVDDKNFKAIRKALKEKKIEMQDLFLLEKGDKVMEITVSLATKSKKKLEVKEVEKIFSTVFGNYMRAFENAPLYLMDSFQKFQFCTKPAFHVLTGVARAVKENESVSGDSYGFLETQEGHFIALLSDGMGSGEKACRDSEMVVELAERFLEAGYPMKKTVQLLNGVLAASVESGNMSTFDACNVDLYTGESSFCKVGAAMSFIKRDSMVEQITAGSLPLGVFHEMEPEQCQKTLMDGDYIVMVSDGIVEGLSQSISEDAVFEAVSKMEPEHPREMANSLLNLVIRKTGGKIRDDMSVIVMGLWENVDFSA